MIWNVFVGIFAVVGVIFVSLGCICVVAEIVENKKVKKENLPLWNIYENEGKYKEAYEALLDHAIKQGENISQLNIKLVEYEKFAAMMRRVVF